MDINGDGVLDIVSGSYSGKITQYSGIKGGGFEAPVEMMQYHNPDNKTNWDDVQFSSLTLADYNDDGLLDGFVGGIRGVRVMINVGTPEEAKFGKRNLLIKRDGKPISVYYDHEPGYDAADYKSYVYCLDWDRDGVKDIITACAYEFGDQHSIVFYKGVAEGDGFFYEEGVPLFKQEKNEKALPGGYIMPYFGDYNNDGIMDMLVGVKLKANINDGLIDTVGAYTYTAPKSSVLSYHLGNVAKQKYADNPEALAKEQARIKELCAEMAKDEQFKMNPNPYSRDHKHRGYLLYFEGVK